MDSPAFATTLAPELDGLRRFALRLCRDAATAEDLVQDTALRALRAFHGFNHEARPRPWLMRILWNAYLDHKRRRARERALDEAAEPASEGRDPERTAAMHELEGRLRAAMGQLPAEQRAVVTLVDLEEMRYREAAEVLGVPIGTVMSRLSRGRAGLAVALGSPV
jgi:RNA polymerase sigma-70 factor (ECF subfamily)